MAEGPPALPDRLPRRDFLGLSAGWLSAFLPLAGPPRGLARTGPAGGDHPTPRPGITAEKVLPADKLGGDAEVIFVFDQVREIPRIMDGIRCHCGCADQPSHYSLLSCFEDGMAIACPICKGQARMAHRLNKAGKSLDEIRESIDARYG
jgi:hypothetical protein